MQQTFKFNISDIPTTDVNNDDILMESTEMDSIIDGFVEGLLEESKRVISKQVFNTPEFLIYLIEFMPMSPEEEKAYNEFKARQSGIVIPDLKLT